MQKIYTFKSGLRLALEKKKCNSVALCVMVNTGSTNEDEKNNGISHFIEHAMFKGTKKRTAEEICVRADEIGALINAYTSEFVTCYHTHSIRSSLENCFELLSDMLNNSLFSDEQLDLERKVILEELTMYADDPANVAVESSRCSFYAGTPLEKLIIGTKECLANIHHKEIMEYVKQRYVPENIVISVAGDIDFDETYKLAEKYFEKYYKSKNEPVVNSAKNNIIAPKSFYVCNKKDIEQAHVCMVFPACIAYSKDSESTKIFNNVFGQTMSSRLFQTIREKLGYVYTIRSYFETSSIGGDICIYFGTNPKNVKNAVKYIKEEIDNIIKNGFTQSELNKGKISLTSQYLVSSDSAKNLADKNGVNVFDFGKMFNVKSKISKIEKVTLQEVNNIAKSILTNKPVISLVAKDISEDISKYYVSEK